MQLKGVLLLFSMVICGCSSMWGQVSKVGLGTTKATLMAAPLNGFALTHQSNRSVTFVYDKTPGQTKKLTFTLRNDVVMGINTTQTMTGPSLREIAINFFDEFVKDWEQKPSYQEDPELTAQTKQTFKAYKPKVRAFFDEIAQRRMVIMLYQKNEQTILTQLSQQL